MTQRERTALVLAGGGSFGAVQVGMLRALAANGLAPDLIVGSSVGAINGAWFAGAPDADGVAQLAAIWQGLRRREVFPIRWRDLVGLASHRDHIVDPAGLRTLLERHLPYREIEQAAVPLHVVATDQLHGKLVRLSSGSVVDAVLASCAVPAVFPPVHIADLYLIDGAIASNTPIRVAVDLGATRIIVLPTGFACALEQPPTSALGNALHAITLLIAHQLVDDLQACRQQAEVIIVPPLCPLAVSPYDFSRAGELIDRAAEQTASWLEASRATQERVPGALHSHEH
ncbi:MAG TPA: patatin-like phospholipase family protein [Burkholderiaceae bacterium]|nr:patatin-like phospholipase family protein [Burkholderiaceae bacterium]